MINAFINVLKLFLTFNTCTFQVTLDQKVVVQTLTALNEARIAYPGKSEKAAEHVLDKVTAIDPNR